MSGRICLSADLYIQNFSPMIFYGGLFWLLHFQDKMWWAYMAVTRLLVYCMHI